MKYFKLKNKNKVFTHANAGFTLIETLVAIFILTLALDGLFALTANTLFSARYAKNEFTANYLLQEAVDYIRNDRDSTAFQKNTEATPGWPVFLAKYGYNNADSPLCFSPNGCYIEPAIATNNILLCSEPSSSTAIGVCPLLNFDADAENHDYYTYKLKDFGAVTTKSVFRRQVLMFVPTDRPNELDVKVTVEWLNGNLVRSRSLWFSLLNWSNVVSTVVDNGGTGDGGGAGNGSGSGSGSLVCEPPLVPNIDNTACVSDPNAGGDGGSGNQSLPTSCDPPKALDAPGGICGPCDPPNIIDAGICVPDPNAGGSDTPPTGA